MLVRLRRDEGGLAFMEFALALPLIMMVFLCGIELVNVALTHQQLSRMATQTADLAARYRSSIDETDITTLFIGTELSHDLPEWGTRGRMVLSSVMNNNKGGHWVRWQRCYGDLSYKSAIGEAGDGDPDDGNQWNDDEIPTVNGMTVLWPNTVMFAEVVYDYQPLFSATSVLAQVGGIFKPRRISYDAAFIARELSLQEVTNTTGVPEGERQLCPWN